MKVEGTPEEIKNFVQTKNFNPKDFFNGNESGGGNGTTGVKWVVIPAVLFLISLVINIFYPATDKWSLLINVLGLCSVLWLAFSSQILWKQKTITLLIPLFGLVLLLVSASQMSLAQALEKFEKYTQECTK